MKKIYFIIFLSALILLFILLVNVPKKDSKFYLDEDYYNSEGSFIEIENQELDSLIKSKKSFVIFTYLPYCTFSIPCDVIFETFLKENKMSFYSIPYDQLSKLEYFNEVKYAPSVILINKGVIVTYLDANSDENLNMYQDSEEFSKWMKNYIYVK